METQQFLKEFFEKAKKVAIHKLRCSEREFLHVALFDDGTVNIASESGCRGEYTVEYDNIDLDDLDKTPEQLDAEWKQIVEDRKKKAAEEKQAREERESLEEERKQYELYIQLKEKYDKNKSIS